MKNRTILHGDVLEKIAEIPDESISVIVTSPPYYQLRSYQQDGQIGLEATIPEYLDKMMAVMAQCKRVLKPTGTCWVNLGDSYAGSGKGVGGDGSCKETFTFDKVPKSRDKIRPKSLMGVPERFVARCIDDGWILRNKIPWVKGNALPCSFKDRFQNTWESVFFFAKSERNYANLDNVRIPITTPPSPIFNYRIQRVKQGQITSNIKASQTELISTDGRGSVKRLTKQDIIPDGTGKSKPTVSGFNERWRASREGLTKKDFVDRPGDAPIQSGLSSARKSANRPGQTPQTLCKVNSGGFNKFTGESSSNPKGKNPGDVFYINSTPLRTKCRHCSWEAADIRTRFGESGADERYCHTCKKADLLDHHAAFPVELPHYILRFAGPPKGMVLDPFLGAGSTAVAAERLGMAWCGIELSEDYILYTRKRLEKYLNVHLI